MDAGPVFYKVCVQKDVPVAEYICTPVFTFWNGQKEAILDFWSFSCGNLPIKTFLCKGITCGIKKSNKLLQSINETSEAFFTWSDLRLSQLFVWYGVLIILTEVIFRFIYLTGTKLRLKCMQQLVKVIKITDSSWVENYICAVQSI